MELCEEERIPLVQEIEQLDQRESAYNALVVSLEITFCYSFDHAQHLQDKFKRKQDILKKEATRITGLRSRLGAYDVLCCARSYLFMALVDARQKNIKLLLAKPTAEKQSIKLREQLQEINQQRMQYIREFTVRRVLSQYQLRYIIRF